MQGIPGFVFSNLRTILIFVLGLYSGEAVSVFWDTLSWLNQCDLFYETDLIAV